MSTNFEPHEDVIFVRSTKIGTHENKASHSRFLSMFQHALYVFTVLLYIDSQGQLYRV